jgi:predicted oxidoreductase
MQNVFISDSGPKVSPAIYGFYRWAEIEVTEQNVEFVLQHCLELGINSFDHADIYGGYRAEQVFGKVLEQSSVKREDIVLFTKAGSLLPHVSRPDIRVPHFNTSAAHIQRSLEQSLKNLRTDYIDIFLLNGLDPISDLEETAFTLKKLKDSGKVRHIGIVNFSVFQHQLLAAYLHIPIVTHHIELNLLNTSAFDNGQIDYLRQRYIRPLATAPLAEGRIALDTTKRSLRVRGKLESLAEKYGVHFESIAIAWLIKLGALPLVGSNNPDRIRNIVKGIGVELEHQEWYELYEASKD